MSPGRRRAIAIAILAGAFVLAELPDPAAGPELVWQSDLEAGLRNAAASARPALLSFHASWCSICARLDRRTLRDPEVGRELERFERIRIDVSRTTPESQALMAHYGAVALPSLVLLGGDGDGVAGRVVGYVSPDVLLPLLRQVR